MPRPTSARSRLASPLVPAPACRPPAQPHKEEDARALVSLLSPQGARYVAVMNTDINKYTVNLNSLRAGRPKYFFNQLAVPKIFL